MTIDNSTMGEQPIYICKAHVFHIDPKTKRSWIPASNAAVNVSFFYDSTRNLYRIISVENTKAVINSTITSSMTFTKTSQKFGQWSDVRANTVYGLGFSNENELNQFIDKFQEVKEATKQGGQKVTANGTATTPTTSATASPVVSRSNQPGAADHGLTINPPNQPFDSVVPVPVASSGAPLVPEKPPQSQIVNHQRSQSLTGPQLASDSPKHQPKVADKLPPGPQFATAGTAPVGEAQLKYENERLKAALAQRCQPASSANAKKWEIELQTLKTNNARLTSALQESTANVEEWKRQLQAYKDENARTRTRLLELEASKGSTDAALELRKELQSMKTKVEAVEVELQSKDEEIKMLTRNLMEVTAKAGEDRVKVVLQENDSLKNTISRLQSQLEIALAAQESQRRVLDALNIQFGERIQDLSTIQDEINTALNT